MCKLILHFKNAQQAIREEEKEKIRNGTENSLLYFN